MKILTKWLTRAFKWSVLSVCALLVIGIAYLTIRPMVARTLDLSTYDAEVDADKYIALPRSGKNYAPNSWLGYRAGRYYLKGRTAAAVVAAYDDLAASRPELSFSYGETGWNGGGRFYPHRTHRTGMSVDFMTPVRRREPSGRWLPAELPGAMTNGWGYYLRLGPDGCLRREPSDADPAVCLDAEAMIAHLAALNRAAGRYGLRIERVIFDPPLLARLREHQNYASIRALPCMEKRAWFPHDGHYHVDFVRR